MINEFVSTLLAQIGSWLFDHTIGLIDPFWGWAVEGVLIIAACFAAAWFFSILRPVAGAVVLATVTFLVGFWKGESRDR